MLSTPDRPLFSLEVLLVTPDSSLRRRSFARRSAASPFAALLLAVALAAPAAGSPAEVDLSPAALLPPELPWGGESRSLIAAPDDPWITPAEKTGLTETPRYAETMAWLERLVAASPRLAWAELGASPEGRALRMVVASADGASTPEALRASGRPVLLAHSGIHSGEIDGKDAGMMLLRDLVFGSRQELLERASLLFLPILNVDGHERFGPWNRVNQRGPESMGWRTNAQNLNLNRDFAKLDTPEVRALVAAFERWRPDLYVDLHVTDGADYLYDVTYGYNGAHAYSPAIARWLDEKLTPAADRALEAAGHVPGPLIFLVDGRDPGLGNFGWTAGPRFSSGYGDARHLASVLVENHSLKPYPQRVLGTYVFLVAALETLGREGESLRQATAADRARRRDPLPLAWEVDAEKEPPTFRFLGVAAKPSLSPVSGAPRIEYTGEPEPRDIPMLVADRPAVVAERPVAYWIPPAWSEVIARLEAHGVELERTSEPRELEVEMYRLLEPELDPEPFEGRVRVSAGLEVETRRELFPAGSVRVPTDQPLGDLAMLLLEPGSPDSFFQWGFFHSVLQRTEYIESYVLEPLAERMLAADPELAEAFRRALATDPELAASPEARLDWFYSRTPYFDPRWRLYPVARE